MFLQNVVKPVLEDYNYALSVGKFPDIPSLKGIVSPDKVGIMAETIVAQELRYFDYNGDVVPHIVDRGAWSAEVASSRKPYRYVAIKTTSPSGTATTKLEQHTVKHLGCVWGCVVDKTQDQPRWNSTGWQLVEGDTRYSMIIESTEGYAFFRGQVDTVLYAAVHFGNLNITADVLAHHGVEIVWLRDSGNVPADNSWKPRHQDGNRLSLLLDNRDMPSQFGFSVRKVKFICRCYIPVEGGETVEVMQFIGFKS